MKPFSHDVEKYIYKSLRFKFNQLLFFNNLSPELLRSIFLLTITETILTRAFISLKNIIFF